MFTYRLLLMVLGVSLTGTGIAMAQEDYGLGREATEDEIVGWDIDVPPSGDGLPAGSGSVMEGKKVYESQCQMCHGASGENTSMDRLVGGEGSLAGDKPVKTVSSYWPYATTLFDYIYRAMPFDSPQSLSAEETYAVTAYVLHLSGIVDDDAVLDASSLPEVEMPNRNGFERPDPRPDVDATACMQNC